MRHNDARKWLHAVLDLLPVILIPVFMIYSHRHDVTQDFEVVEEVPIYYETNEVNSIDDILIGNYYHWKDNYTYVAGQTQIKFMRILNDINIRTQLSISETYSDCELWFINNNAINQLRVDIMRSNTYVDGITLSGQEFDFCVESINNQQVLSSYISYIDECQSQYVKEYQEITTTIPHDVMTSFMDRFNNTINQYFNMGNIFNMGNVYQWFEINIFGGTAPTVIYSVWNIVLYEFVMDLLFLLYGLFMWFIDMCKKLMEKPLNSIK